MSKLIINDKIELEGSFNIEREYDKDAKPPIMYKRGILQLPKYIDEIFSIENDLYVINGIEVYKEVFASDEKDVGYEFSYKNLRRK